MLPSPIRFFGLVWSALVVACDIHQIMKSEAKRLCRLQAKLLGVRQITEAKNISVRICQIIQDAAYDLIWDQAINKRVTTKEIAAAIVNANEILPFGESTK